MNQKPTFPKLITEAECSLRLAKALQGLIEGDDPEDAAAILHSLGYTDEGGFWIYD